MPKEGETRRNPATGEIEDYAGGEWRTSKSYTAPSDQTAPVDDTGLGGGGIEFREINGRTVVVGHDLFGNETYEGSFAGADGAGGGQARNDMLSAAIDALNGFLQAQSLSDARRLSAFEQFQKASQFALPKGASPPGYEPGGSAHMFNAAIGGKQYTPPPIQTQTVDPSALSGPAPIPPEVMQMISGILSAGGAPAQPLPQ